MNSGLIGALGAAPLQTVKNRLGSFQGTRHLNLLLPKDGALVLGPSPDGTVNGGNKRGIGAIDIQTERSAANQVAAGPYAIAIGRRNYTPSDGISIGNGNGGNNGGPNDIKIGTGNVTDGFSGGAIAIGRHASANPHCVAVGVDVGTYSGPIAGSPGKQLSSSFGIRTRATEANATAFGYMSLSDRFGMYSWNNIPFSTFGDSQHAIFLLRNRTTNNTPTNLFLNTTSTLLTIPSGKILSCLINIVGTKSDGSAVAQFVRKACIKNVAGTTSLVNSVETIGTDSASGTSVLITADDTNDALKIEVTGIASETWRWIAYVEGVEIAYGT